MRGLTHKEFRYWEIANELDPFTEERQDWRIATITQMLFNIHRGKGQKALPLKDFVLPFGPAEPKPKQTPAQQFAMLKILAAMHATDVIVPKVILTDGPIEVTPSGPPTPREITELEKARLAMGVQAKGF